MNNLPDTVQWVLDFLNIDNTPGKSNLYGLPDELRKLKRPPIPKRSPNLKLINNRLIDESTGYQWRIINNEPPKDRVDTFQAERDILRLQEEKIKLLEKLGIKVQESMLSDSEIIEKLRESLSTKREEIVPKQNILEIIENLDLEKDIEFEGINNDPTLEDYKQFFLKKGIPPYKGKDLLLENGKPLLSLDIKSYNNRPKNNNEPGFYDYYQNNPRIEHTFYEAVLDVRWELLKILRNIVHGTKSYGDEREAHEALKGYMKEIERLYLECWERDEVPAESGRTSWGAPYRGRYDIVLDCMRNKESFPHYGMIPHALYACILDFGINHKELLSCLRQCPYCGKFWFEPENKRPGRKRIFCSEDCKRIFHQQSRSDNLKAVKIKRDYLKEKKQKEDHSQLIKFLFKNGYTQNEAEKESFEWVCKKGKTFKEFKRTRAVSYGLK